MADSTHKGNVTNTWNSSDVQNIRSNAGAEA